MTASRTQVTFKMSPIKSFASIESIEVIHVSVILPGAIVHSMFKRATYLLDEHLFQNFPPNV